MTVRELIEKLQQYPEDLPVYTPVQNTMEQSGLSLDICIYKEKLCSETVPTWDSFDGIDYTYTRTNLYFDFMEKDRETKEDFKGPFEAIVIR